MTSEPSVDVLEEGEYKVSLNTKDGDGIFFRTAAFMGNMMFKASGSQLAATVAMGKLHNKAFDAGRGLTNVLTDRFKAKQVLDQLNVKSPKPKTPLSSTA